jgi:hypothetical protein
MLGAQDRLELDALRKRLQPDAKKLLHEMMEAPREPTLAARWNASGWRSTPSTPRRSPNSTAARRT